MASIVLFTLLHHTHSISPDFVRASVDAAIEYVKLGKTQRALAIYAHALTAVTTPTTISDEVRVSLFLHYAETLALNGNTEKRYFDHTCFFSELLIPNAVQICTRRLVV